MQKIELIQRYRLFLKNRIKSDFFYLKKQKEKKN